MSSSSTRRPRAPQGSGEQLRDEIVAAAMDLLVSSGNPEHVTLRAVARQVGISAPSIYLHFVDRDALLFAVLMTCNDRFTAALTRADPGERVTPVEQLRSIGRGYLRFAEQQPGAYQTLFNGLLPLSVVDTRVTEGDMPSSFAVLYFACVRACRESGGHQVAMQVALRLWSGMHGFVTLRINQPGFPWPSTNRFLEDTMLPLIPR